ncbi:hypothetical protein SAMN05216345_11758 [Cupriavidus sp. YR651]|uniref:DUF883 family protein n=1 Tax=Cupriavidus sp. YR651 TaxID=1855315 RepID=UPI000880E812|nr:DUF883 family protein [Cupriavidus sp. YR651]SDD82411.1 hypothetical protein SAMN05216345_11758 [Cupriavidus sp. YR651]
MNDTRAEAIKHRKVLRGDVDVLLTDIQALLRDVPGEANEGPGRARGDLTGRVQELRARLSALCQEGEAGVEPWVDSTDRYAHEHP